MIAEILSVGTELLMGQIVNTDARYIAARLCGLGVDSYFQQVVGDNEDRLLSAIRLAEERSDVLILTGGLGPTKDDLTRETLALHLGLPLLENAVCRADMEEWMKGRGRSITSNNYRQVCLPEGALPFRNERGTAPGFAIRMGKKHYIVLPGPPNELEYMVDRSLVPYLRELSGDQIVSRTLRFFGIGESALADRLRELIDEQGRVTIAPYAGLGEVSLRLSVKVGAQEDAEPLLDGVQEKILSLCGEYLYGIGDAKLPEVTAKLLLEKNKTLSLAESCTGGMIASELVALPGISAALMEGVVCYSNEAKMRRLGVKEETLCSFGAVSKECAREMALGERSAAGTDFAIAVTGIAGPDGGSPEKPVGLVYIALADESGVQVRELRLRGERGRIRRLSMLNALDMLRRAL